jgi:hypothetical protein
MERHHHRRAGAQRSRDWDCERCRERKYAKQQWIAFYRDEALTKKLVGRRVNFRSGGLTINWNSRILLVERLKPGLRVKVGLFVVSLVVSLLPYFAGYGWWRDYLILPGMFLSMGLLSLLGISFWNRELLIAGLTITFNTCFYAALMFGSWRLAWWVGKGS